MPAYVIGHIRVKDPDRWDEYRARVPATLPHWGGELVLRGQQAEVLDGTHDYTDTVVLRFPDREAARSWHASPEYQAIVPLRRAAADVLLLAYSAAI